MVDLNDRLVESFIKNSGYQKLLIIGENSNPIMADLKSEGIPYLQIAHENNKSTDLLLRICEVDDLKCETLVVLDIFDQRVKYSTGEITNLLSEFFRIARSDLILRINSQNEDLNLGEHLSQGWWESECFNLGFYRHPCSFEKEYLDFIEANTPTSLLYLTKKQSGNQANYSNDSTSVGDFLRQTSSKLDPLAIQYKLASAQIKPGDRILELSCGCGAGLYVVDANSMASQLTGIDRNKHNIDYALNEYARNTRLNYSFVSYVDYLQNIPDTSFEVIIVLSKLGELEEYFSDINRLLVPGGRVIFNCCVDYTAIEETQQGLFDSSWLIEPLDNLSSVLRSSSRLIQLVAMKSPIDESVSYVERVFENIIDSEHPSVRYAEYYQFPWLMHAMVNSGYRLKSKNALSKLVENVLAKSKKYSNDYAAALCVKAYQILQDDNEGKKLIESIQKEIIAYLNSPISDLMGLRWHISLCSISAKLYFYSGNLKQAKKLFVKCIKYEGWKFSVHILTKLAEAHYFSGRIALTLGDVEGAKNQWRDGVQLGKKLLGVSLEDVLINSECPNRFNHGDGIREYIVAWDFIARCANGVYESLKSKKFNWSSFENSFQTEYLGVCRDLREVRELLVERTKMLESSHLQLKNRTEELVSNRAELIDRTQRLESTNKNLGNISDELKDLRDFFVEKTQLLQQIDQDLLERTSELVETRNILSERTTYLEVANQELLDRTAELVATRNELKDRTESLDEANDELVGRTAELVLTRNELKERTTSLEKVSQSLVGRTAELVATRDELKERTEALEQANHELLDRTNELIKTRSILAERSVDLNEVSQVLVQRTNELELTREDLVQRTRTLELVSNELQSRTEELVDTREVLKSRTIRLEDLDIKLIEKSLDLSSSLVKLQQLTEVLESQENTIENKQKEMDLLQENYLKCYESLKSAEKALYDFKNAPILERIFIRKK